MAVQLFKDGQMQVFNEHNFLDQLKAGWSFTDGDDVDVTPEVTENATLEEVIEGIGCLDDDNTEHWTDLGLPMVAAIETLLGKPLVAGQRNEAWEIIKAG